MRPSHRFIAIFLLATIWLLVILPPPVSATPQLTVTGVKLLTNVSPGEVITHKMTVSIGKKDRPVDIFVDVGGFGQSPDMSYQFLKPQEDTSPYSARTFITLDKTSFHLEPGHSEEITATITVPKDVGAGGRYALINIHTGPVGEGAVGVITGVAVPIMLSISDIIKTGSITDLSVSTTSPIVISTTFKNTGNHHYYGAQNHVRVTNERGNEVAVASTSPSLSAIIPTYSVKFDVTLKQVLPPGKYYIDSKVTLEDGTILDEAKGSFEVKEPYVPSPPSASLTLTPASQAILETENGRISIFFPKGAVLEEVEISLRSYPLEQLPCPPSGFKLATTCFRVDGLTGLLAKEAKITVKYTQADLDKAKGDASRLRLARWDEAQNQWSVLKTKVDKKAMTLTTNTNQLSLWAVMVAPPRVVNWVLLGGAGVIITALLVYFFAIRRRE